MCYLVGVRAGTACIRPKLRDGALVAAVGAGLALPKVLRGAPPRPAAELAAAVALYALVLGAMAALGVGHGDRR